MRTNRLRMVAAGTVAAVALSATGLAGTAQADPADDLQIILDNLPTALDVLQNGAPFRGGGLQPTLDAFLADTDFTDLGFNLTLTSIDTVGALVRGTEQFGAAGLGFLLLGAGVLEVITPFLEALDDPSTAGDLVNPDDLSTILDQIDDSLDTLQPGLVIALVEGLEGNLTADSFIPGIGQPALIGSGTNAVAFGLGELLDNTNYEDVAILANYALLVAAAGTAGQAKTLEDALLPLFEALAPATAPIIEALEGV